MDRGCVRDSGPCVQRDWTIGLSLEHLGVFDRHHVFLDLESPGEKSSSDRGQCVFFGYHDPGVIPGRVRA